MGLPPTSPSRSLKMPDEELLDDGYDSDFKMGSFYEDGVEEEELVDMDEVALGDENPNIPTTENVENHEDSTLSDPVPILTDEEIDKTKVVELRTELKKRGLSKNGFKDVFV